jgi:hypothetical protein
MPFLPWPRPALGAAPVPWDDASTCDEDPWTISPNLLDFHSSHINNAAELGASVT